MFYILFFVYNFFWFLALIFFAIYFFVRRETEVLKQRLGLYQLENAEPIWIHAASVGELKIAEKLIEEIRKKTMQPILLTLVTKTSYELAINKFGFNIYVKYAPFDFLPTVLFFLNKFRITKFLIIETEIWPSYLVGARFENIPVYLLNARLSDKSYPKYLKYKTFFSSLINNFNLIFAQSKEDKKKFANLGVKQDKILVFDNIKYDLLEIVNDINHEKDKLFAKRSVFSAGSIRSGEENFIVQSFIETKIEITDILLILAPRHIENVPKLEKLLVSKSLSYLKLSDVRKNKNIKFIESDVLLVDTMGALIEMYKNSDVVFVGGSLVDKGGQNIIEPLSLGKLVIFGPHMNNFKEIARKIIDAKGAIQLKNETELTAQMTRYLKFKDERCHIIHKALQTLKNSRGNAKKIVEALNI